MTTIPNLSDAVSISATTVFPVVKAGDSSATRIDGTGLATFIGADHLPVDVRGAGAAYPLTITPTQLTNLGSCLVSGRVGDVFNVEFQVQVEYNGATFAARQDVVMSVYLDDGTPAAVTNGTLTLKTDITTTHTGLMTLFTYKFPYTLATTSDLLKLYGSVAVAPSAGSLDVIAGGTFIHAERSVPASV